MHVCAYVYVCVHVCVHAYVCMCVCIYVCVKGQCTCCGMCYIFLELVLSFTFMWILGFELVLLSPSCKVPLPVEPPQQPALLLTQLVTQLHHHLWLPSPIALK